MAQICIECLTTHPKTTNGRCPPCDRDNEATRREPAHVRYPPEYKANRAIVLNGNPDCYWGCGRKATTADHLIPRSKGGSHRRDNLVPACSECNTARGDTPAEQWAADVASRNEHSRNA